MKHVSMFFTTYGECACLFQIVTICMHWRLLSSWFRSVGGLGGDESCRFRSPKSVEEEDALHLLSQSKPKSVQNWVLPLT